MASMLAVGRRRHVARCDERPPPHGGGARLPGLRAPAGPARRTGRDGTGLDRLDEPVVKDTDFRTAARGDEMVRDHEEFDVVIVGVARVGSRVRIEGPEGEEGFIDQAKHPSWWSREASPPAAGDRLHVVVLDASRTPPRLSALEDDIAIGRRLRDAG
ncbi:hypothetical protein AB0D99_19175 [Streptomyces sp. NPDC047971]|uniref:hypothetical protein n=1 Tax=Streptomyces sp. NPDC047971 TaxID=3154499 RepID=UPI0033CC08A5